MHGHIYLEFIITLYSVVFYHFNNGPCSSVGIATDCELDGPGIESRWSEVFRPRRPALGPTQPPVRWVPGLPWG